VGEVSSYLISYMIMCQLCWSVSTRLHCFTLFISSRCAFCHALLQWNDWL